MSIAYIFWAMNYFDGQEFIMAGQSVGSLERNVIIKLIGLLKNSKEIKFGVKHNIGKHYFDVFYRNKRNRFYCFGGSDSDSYEAVQGMTAAGCMLDEITLLHPEFVDQCTSRCSVDGSKIWINCNPREPLHWFKTDWIDDAENMKALVLKFNMDDNPSLSEEKKAEYRRRYKGVFYNRYINGEWSAGQGVIYENWKADDFNYQRMLLEKDYYRRDKYIKLTGMDFGFSNDPTAVVASLFDKPNNTLYIYDEIYETKLLQKDIVAKAKAKGLGKYTILADNARPDTIAELRELGLNISGAPKTTIEQGIQRVQELNIIVHPQCVNTIAEFNSYAWENDKKTKKPTNKPIDKDNHIMDALRYSLQGVGGNFSFGA